MLQTNKFTVPAHRAFSPFKSLKMNPPSLSLTIPGHQPRLEGLEEEAVPFSAAEEEAVETNEEVEALSSV